MQAGLKATHSETFETPPMFGSPSILPGCIFSEATIYLSLCGFTRTLVSAWPGLRRGRGGCLGAGAQAGSGSEAERPRPQPCYPATKLTWNLRGGGPV